jgi:uncharacterized membrane protein
VELRRISFIATLHCLTGCAIGEILGMFLGTYFGLSNSLTIALAIFLAFIFGYSLTLIPLLKHMSFKSAVSSAFVSDTDSISVMEIVDNAIIILIPGALHAHVSEPLFWGSLALALFVAFWFALPVNYWLIKRGKGHATVHSHH